MRRHHQHWGCQLLLFFHQDGSYDRGTVRCNNQMDVGWDLQQQQQQQRQRQWHY
jgi:hypothetical protein